jgi:hypothetical protein
VEEAAGLSDESGTTNSERDFSADEKGDGDATQFPCAVTKGQAKEKSSNTGGGGCSPVSELPVVGSA